MERKFPPGRLQGAPGLPLLNLEKPIQYAQKTDPRADGRDGLVGFGECPRVVVPGVEHPLPLLEADAAARRVDLLRHAEAVVIADFLRAHLHEGRRQPA